MTSQRFIERFRKVFGGATPMGRFEKVLQTMPDSTLYQKAHSAVKRRIDGDIR